MKRFLVAVLALASLAAAQTPPQPPSQSQRSGEQILLDADRAFERETAQRRLEGWMSFMAADAVLFSAKPVVGSDAIRAFYQPAFSNPDFALSWQPARAEMFPSGDMGYTTGRYELHAKDAKGTTVVRHGTYFTVWKKQQDGTWKVVADGGAPDPH